MSERDWMYNAYRPHTLGKDCWCIADANRQYPWAVCGMMIFFKEVEPNAKD